jgi:1-acyl-sn-glycerol-3-phosphate acyltransferase
MNKKKFNTKKMVELSIWIAVITLMAFTPLGYLKIFAVDIALIVIPVASIRLGLKVKGRKNLRKYKDVLKKGVVSCCNHVHMWDFIGLTHGVRFFKPKFLVWDKNIKGALGGTIRLLGGIPLPIDDISAQLVCTRAVKNHLNNGGWLHVYSEGSAWEYYKPIRPFKKGTASYAVMCNKPILPMAFTYRKPGFIRRCIFKQIALYTLNIGEPIYKNDNLSRSEQEIEQVKKGLRKIIHQKKFDPPLPLADFCLIAKDRWDQDESDSEGSMGLCLLI